MKKTKKSIIFKFITTVMTLTLLLLSASVNSITSFAKEENAAADGIETPNFAEPNYLTFTAAQAGSTISLSWLKADSVKYSTDGGKSWSTYKENTVITLKSVNASVKFRGKNVVTGFDDWVQKGDEWIETYKNFKMKGKIKASGSVTSLTDANGGDENVSLAAGCYKDMFASCSALVSAPELPATKLNENCYQNMFLNCTSLTEAPELPALVMKRFCYSGMFAGCKKLKTAPNLPAKTLAPFCYGGQNADGNYGMFEGCSSLQIKNTKDASHQLEWKIPATKENDSWSWRMFFDCPGVDMSEDGPELGVTYYQTGKESHIHSYKTVIIKATTTKNGSIKKVCKDCGYVASTKTIYYPKSIKLSKEKFTYNGKQQKPTVTIIDANNNKIEAENYDISYDTGLKDIGEYKVTITFKGNYTGKVTKTFTINPKKTALVSVQGKSKQMTVKWKKQATQVTGYEIQYSANSNFKSAKKVTVTSAKTTSKTIKELKSGSTYYVRIRTYKKVGSKKYYSDWSTKKSVKVK